MRKFIVLIIFILLNTPVFSQNTFEKIIDTLGCDYASCIQETFDGGYVFCGKSSMGGNDVIIVKLDSVGTIEWAKVYGGPSIEAASYIEQTPDSGYMVNALYDGGGLNAKSWLLRLDINGDTLWTQTFSAGIGSTIVNDANSMASINSTVYGMTGYFKPQPLTIISAYFISSIGNGFPLANKIFDTSPYGTEAYAINKTFDGGFIISSAIGTGVSSSDFYLIRTNAFGDTLWTRTYDNSQNDAGRAIQQTADSGFIVAGYTRYLINAYNIYLIKTDSIGDTLWTKQYVDTVTGGANSIQQTLDGGYIIAGVRLGEMYIIKTNAWGDTLWTRTFGDSQNLSQAFNVRQTQDGGYIISGTGTIGSAFGAYIIKTDSLGIVSSGTGIAEVNNPLLFDVYPNPASEILNVKIKGVSGRNASLTIYNMNGQLVYATGVKNNATVQIDLSVLPYGMYAVSLRSNNRIFIRKILHHQ
jgi:Secretion system C-terminal sorting domain